MRACFDENNFEIDFGFIGRFTDMDAFISVFESWPVTPVDMHHGLAPEIKLLSADAAEVAGACVSSCLKPSNSRCS